MSPDDLSMSDQRYARAERLLGEWLAEQEAKAANGASATEARAEAFEALVAAHPESAAELRELARGVSHVDRGFDEDAARVTRERARVAELLKKLASSRGFSDRYAIEGEFARGGMGVILTVVDRRLDRKLAMKVILGASGSAEGASSTPPLELGRISRFLNEARITGQLEHPGIVPVHEMGVDEQGRTYFTMKLVKGITLEEAFERHAAGDASWSSARILEVLQRVCDALAFAHARRIIHRDLKPLNIMVGDFGEVYVMDWGLARRLDETPDERAAAELLDHELHPADTLTGGTVEGQIIGTPAYMSPEQARGAIAELGPPADVYAIGAMLYRLIAGRPPYMNATAPQPPFLTIIERIKAGAFDSIDRAAVAPELIAICKQALQRDIRDRYQDMRGLADDLRAHLDGKVVRAYETGTWAEAKKWVQRNRRLAGAIGAAVLLLVSGIVVIADLKSDAERSAAASEWQAYVANIRGAGAALDAGDADGARRFLSSAPEALRGWEWGHLDAASDASLHVLRGHEDAVRAVAFSPDGKLVATASKDHSARIWDASTGTELHALLGHEDEVNAIEFSPDGTRVATYASDGTVRIWDIATGKALDELREHGELTLDVAFSPESASAITVGGDNTARIRDVVTGAVLHVLRGHIDEEAGAAFSCNGMFVAAASDDDTIRIWEVSTGVQVQVFRWLEGKITAVAFSPDEKRVIAASDEGTLRIWDVDTGHEVYFTNGVETYEISPDSRHLAVADHHGAARVIPIESDRGWIRLKSDTADISAVSFTPDSACVATVSKDASLRIWDVSTGLELRCLRGHDANINAFAFSADGLRIATGSEDGSTRIWDQAAIAERALAGTINLSGFQGELNTEGTRLVRTFLGEDAEPEIWDVATGEVLHVLRADFGGFVYAADFSRDGRSLATASHDDAVRIWDADTGIETRILRGHETNVCAVAFSPDGALVASGSEDGTIRIWNANSGVTLHVCRGHVGRVSSIIFSSDSKRLITHSNANQVGFKVWDVATGIETGSYSNFRKLICSHDFDRAVALSGDGTTLHMWGGPSWHELRRIRFRGESVELFSPDGTYFVTTNSDGSAGIWDFSAGAEMHVLRGSKHKIGTVAFSPDGTRLVTASENNDFRIWDIATGVELLVFRGLKTNDLAFSHDGARIVAASWDGTARVWDSVAPRLRSAERDLERAATPEARRALDAAVAAESSLSAVAQRLRLDSTLSPLVRRIALRLLLQQSNSWQETAWEWLHQLQDEKHDRAAIESLVRANTVQPPFVREHAQRLIALLKW